MASQSLLSVAILLALTINKIFAADPTSQITGLYPFTCSDFSRTCDSILYQDDGLTRGQIAALYSVNESQIGPIRHGNKQNYLVKAPCSCKNVNGMVGYFYDTPYLVKPNDTFVNVSDQYYSGQAWPVGNESSTYTPNLTTTMHLLCGCVEKETQIVVTYTVQPQDTLSDIATLLSADLSDIEKSNTIVTQRQGYIEVGWVLFVPMYKNGIPPSIKQKGKNHKWTIIIGTLSLVTVLSVCTLAIILLTKKRSREHIMENPKSVTKSMSIHKSFAVQKQFAHRDNMEGFESERPVVYNLGEIAEATNDCDESRKIGEGGYGSVYFGILGHQEVAIKKMRSNKSKEFFAELKVLCKIHHINVVELLGYASGDDHLYLVYEYVSNGSLADHLHDPLLKDTDNEDDQHMEKYDRDSVAFYVLIYTMKSFYNYDRKGLVDTIEDCNSLPQDIKAQLKLTRPFSHFGYESGHQPLSWTARAQIALDSAKGIEYIHDHTKARYVHRDIKTTNILLDEGLRGKVADFGLAKLVGRTNEDDFIATRLVGTPGYLPPESVKELQVTIKTDVFAFGVVLAELITGQCALIRDNREPNKTKSLITVINKVFQDEDPESALEAVTDGNLMSSYPPEDVYKMAEIADWCLSEDANSRPEMREVVVALSEIVRSSVEWEASLGGNSQVFSGVFSGR